MLPVLSNQQFKQQDELRVTNSYKFCAWTSTKNVVGLCSKINCKMQFGLSLPNVMNAMSVALEHYF